MLYLSEFCPLDIQGRRTDVLDTIGQQTAGFCGSQNHLTRVTSDVPHSSVYVLVAPDVCDVRENVEAAAIF